MVRWDWMRIEWDFFKLVGGAVKVYKWEEPDFGETPWVRSPHSKNPEKVGLPVAFLSRFYSKEHHTWMCICQWIMTITIYSIIICNIIHSHYSNWEYSIYSYGISYGSPLTTSWSSCHWFCGLPSDLSGKLWLLHGVTSPFCGGPAKACSIFLMTHNDPIQTIILRKWTVGHAHTHSLLRSFSMERCICWFPTPPKQLCGCQVCQGSWAKKEGTRSLPNQTICWSLTSGNVGVS